MPTVGVTLNAYIVQAQPGQVDVRPQDRDLPGILADYQRSEKTLVVAAVRDSDEITVGMGGGWWFTHPSRPDVLLVKAAAVNEGYAGTGLQREPIEALGQFAEQQGILQLHVPAELKEGFVGPGMRPQPNV
jgi:hypothetical protein